MPDLILDMTRLVFRFAEYFMYEIAEYIQKIQSSRDRTLLLGLHTWEGGHEPKVMGPIFYI